MAIKMFDWRKMAAVAILCLCATRVWAGEADWTLLSGVKA